MKVMPPGFSYREVINDLQAGVIEIITQQDAFANEKAALDKAIASLTKIAASGYAAAGSVSTSKAGDAKQKKNPDAVALGRLGGLKGGPARTKNTTAAQRTEWASKAAEARWRLEE